MISASEHENTAHSQSMNGDNETANVYALLAIASAIERLAESVDKVASEMTPAKPRRW